MEKDGQGGLQIPDKNCHGHGLRDCSFNKAGFVGVRRSNGGVFNRHAVDRLKEKYSMVGLGGIGILCLCKRIGFFRADFCI